MSNGYVDFALWGVEAEAVEDELDIPDDLRRRMKAWAKEDSDRESGRTRAWTAEERLDHDHRGYQMSQELQAVLGDAYFVTYIFNTEEVRRAVKGSSGS